MLILIYVLAAYRAKAAFYLTSPTSALGSPSRFDISPCLPEVQSTFIGHGRSWRRRWTQNLRQELS